MKILPGGSDEGETSIEQAGREGERRFYEKTEETYQAVSSNQEVGSFVGGINARGGSSSEMKQSRLKTYVMSFDGETLQRYATIRSREAVGIIERHTEALFGRPEIVITPQGIDSSKDEHIQISFKGPKRLLLEAVTFGSFLWDVESHVDSRDGHLPRRRLRSCFFVLGSLKTLLSYGCRAVKFKTAESMFPSADRSSKEEQENDRNRSVMVQSRTDLDLRRFFLNATSGSNIFFDKETNAGENIDCGNIFKWSHLQKVDVSGKIVGNQQL
ncbi:unnamed protein product [Brassica rapa subsp. trilocularis]